VTVTRQYGAWGNLETGGSAPGYAFTGRDWDPETGLYYYRARYYDPRIGRFAGEDPIGFKGGLNLFAYVGSNPTTATDPTGLVGIRECFARMGGAAGAMYANWQRMEKAHVPNVDWYFHCMANCEGAQGDPCAAFATWTISAGREAWGYAKWRFIHHMWTPWKTWAWDTAMDWTANDWGRRNSCPQRDCHKVCRMFLPNDLPPGFPR
jgi:RHS repeat-associated protein